MKEVTLNSVLPAAPVRSVETKGGAGDFAELLKNALGEVDRLQKESDRGIEALNSGEAKNLHEVMIAMEKADISLRMAVQMRNKVLEAYQEIMRMQV